MKTSYRATACFSLASRDAGVRRRLERKKQLANNAHSFRPFSAFVHSCIAFPSPAVSPHPRIGHLCTLWLIKKPCKPYHRRSLRGSILQPQSRYSQQATTPKVQRPTTFPSRGSTATLHWVPSDLLGLRRSLRLYMTTDM